MNIYKNWKSGLPYASFLAFSAIMVIVLMPHKLYADTIPPVPSIKPVSAGIAGIVPTSQPESVVETVLTPVVEVKSLVPIPRAKPASYKAPIKPFKRELKEPIQEEDIGAANLKAMIEASKGLKSGFPKRQARFYDEVFSLQSRGHFKEADTIIKKINNPLLMGHVSAQRYFHPSYTSSISELADWLSRYPDHPQAKRIYKLASQKTNNAQSLKQPVSFKRLGGNLSATAKRGKRYISQKSRTNSAQERVNKLKREIFYKIEKGRPTTALDVLSTDYAVQFLDDVEYDQLRANIASGYIYSSKLNEALRLSDKAILRSGAYVPNAGWVKGLVLWQQGDYAEAAKGFELAASSPYASGWLVSAAAYWASRANMRAGNVDLVNKWLELSATYPRTFYGLIATRSLGYDNHFNWTAPNLNRTHTKTIEATAAGKRASALINIKQFQLAEAELANIYPGKSIKIKEALIAYAQHYKLPALSMRLGNAYLHPKGGLYDAALYPIAAWKPSNGYRVDEALIHAIVRQESRFQSMARNPSGATGLMQLMPKTAEYVAGRADLHLDKPEVNLEVGQTYIEQLLDHREVKNDLFSLTMAYNAGPGNLTKWKKERRAIKDPLLFIETIPYNETRAFVERVLANYWIYRMRMGKDTPSLDLVVQGKWARYAGTEASTEKSNLKVIASR